jgi:hypothetical protein
LVPYTRSSSELVDVHCWLAWPLQSQICTCAPFVCEAPLTSRHRFDPTPTSGVVAAEAGAAHVRAVARRVASAATTEGKG